MPVRVTVTGEQNELRLEVKNRGPAIDRTTLDRIFDPFQRGADELDRQADSSLGLGLYIASEIAKAHGGGIEARSDATETVSVVHLPGGSVAHRIARGMDARLTRIGHSVGS
jgi:signal transduction histidine kinase